MDNDVLVLIQLKVGWPPKTEIIKNQNRTQERKKGRNQPTLGQFLLYLPLADYFKLYSFPPSKFYSSLNSISLSKNQTGTAKRIFRGVTIQFPAPFNYLSPTHSSPSFPIENCLVQLYKSNLNCGRLGNSQSFKPNGNALLKENVNYQPSLSPIFQKGQLTLLVITF